MPRTLKNPKQALEAFAETSSPLYTEDNEPDLSDMRQSDTDDPPAKPKSDRCILRIRMSRRMYTRLQRIVAAEKHVMAETGEKWNMSDFCREALLEYMPRRESVLQAARQAHFTGKPPELTPVEGPWMNDKPFVRFETED